MDASERWALHVVRVVQLRHSPSLLQHRRVPARSIESATSASLAYAIPMKRRTWLGFLLSLSSVAVVSTIGACGPDLGDGGIDGCDVARQLGCAGGTVCEPVEGGEPACFEPVVLIGEVHDASTKAPIGEARVIAIDDAGLAISVAARSRVDGSYRLQVPVTRDASGAPMARAFKLRIEAQDYLQFPRAPLDTPAFDAKAAIAPTFEIADERASVGLIRLTDTGLLGTITGRIIADDPRGTLVVVAGATGLSDLDGEYVVNNVKPGNLKVLAFKQGVNFDVGTTTLDASSTEEVELTANEQKTGEVSGTLTGATAPTSVILVQEDTFDPVTVRGEAPPGLRVDGVTTAFSITGVPNGKYVVLPGFFNDGLVRDPNDAVGGTPLATVTVTGSPVAIMTPLAVKPALGVVSPGANAIDTVAGTPKLLWEVDPNADAYHVEVFTMLGAPVWETMGQFDPGDGKPATVDYTGDPLDHGGLYQFRVTSVSMGKPLRRTEDLKGLFAYQ